MPDRKNWASVGMFAASSLGAKLCNDHGSGISSVIAAWSSLMALDEAAAGGSEVAM